MVVVEVLCMHEFVRVRVCMPELCLLPPMSTQTNYSKYKIKIGTYQIHEVIFLYYPHSYYNVILTIKAVN